jgi:putative transposase
MLGCGSVALSGGEDLNADDAISVAMPTRCLVFHLSEPLPSELLWLLKEFRLMVNKIIRIGIQRNISSKFKLREAVYDDFREEHSVYAGHIMPACTVAGSILKNYRKRRRAGLKQNIPFAKRLMMAADNQRYTLDRKTGNLDIPIRAGSHVQFQIAICDYHRKYLDDASLSLGSLTICPDKIIIAIRKVDVKPYKPKSVISLDTNERSLDGVFAKSKEIAAVKRDFSEVSVIQERHFERRKHLQLKKCNDRRTMKRLCGREGKREHDRVESRLHIIANEVIDAAKANKSAIVLEDLNGMSRSHKGVSMNRRLSNWPRRKLHSIIEYKADWEGVPVIFVSPKNTSRTCPICGKIRKSRMSKEFRCECGWRCDVHINASLNMLQKAIGSHEPLARAVRFQPGALRHDPVKSLCSLARGARIEANGASCEGR